jgi:hypothetical protein
MADSPMTYAERYAETVADVALFHAGEPDEKFASSMATMRMNLKTELTKMFVGGDLDLCGMVDRFIDAILIRKHEIDRHAIKKDRSN